MDKTMVEVVKCNAGNYHLFEKIAAGYQGKFWAIFNGWLAARPRLRYLTTGYLFSGLRQPEEPEINSKKQVTRPNFSIVFSL